MKKNYKIIISTLLLCLFVFPIYADNPIITNIYTADPAALIYNNTFYIYCGHDEASSTGTNFYMRDWHVLSSTNMVDWTDHGALLSVNNFSWANADAWAGHCVYNNGRFWWYVPVNHSSIGWMSIGVASSTSPTGPFTDAKGSAIITDNTSNSSALNIDPCVFVDDDGQVYLVWGCYWEIRMVKLQSNMIDMIGTPIKPSGVNNFWEAPWLFKRNGTYYLLYAAGANPATIEYCTASNPMGPFTHRGIMFGTTSSPTNHPAAVEYKGQWYFVYHTADAPGGGEFRRSVCVDYMYFNSDGTIQRVIATRDGVDPVDDNQTPVPTTVPTQTPVSEPTPQPPSGENLAPDASRSTSHCSAWEDLAAINDGYDPTDSNDRNHLVYGNWPETGTQWIQYDWSMNVIVSGMDVYWFDDNLGIDLPSSCRLLYWNGSSFVAVSGANGYGVAGNQYNRTSFNQVTTTRLRLEMTSNGSYSTGVLEWKVYGESGGVTAVPTNAPTPAPTATPASTQTPVPGGQNVALLADASTSYCSSWETIDALNDGYDPSDSNDESHPQYGNWPETGTQWVQYNWSDSVTVNRIDVYWFDDPYGIDCPSSCRLLYWNGSSFVEVTGPSGYGVIPNQYNTTTFTTITTTRLRLEFTSSGSQSTGILEWKVISQ